jgi:hypothetical protein
MIKSVQIANVCVSWLRKRALVQRCSSGRILKLGGVTFDNDARFTTYRFGDYKSDMRLKTEEKLRIYMREPSKPRAEGLKDFAIAVTIAAPGTGKTRLIDDAMRMRLSARDGEVDHFDDFLRLAVTFNSNYGGAYVHPLTARMLMLFNFFCGTVEVDSREAIAPWTLTTPQSGRSIVWLPLGTFDLLDEEVRAVVEHQAKTLKSWPGVEISERVWYLLAATGGRPRDVSSMLARLSPVLRLPQPLFGDLFNALLVASPEPEFRQYLLPSMLNIKFYAMKNGAFTQFGRVATSLALLNADRVAVGAKEAVVPTVSLGHANFFEDPDHISKDTAKLISEVKALILSTTFCKLDGSGKGFERVWVLLVVTVLRLQRIVRTNSDFWPKPGTDAIQLGGLARPKEPSDDFRALGGAAFRDTYFFRHLANMNEK